MAPTVVIVVDPLVPAEIRGRLQQQAQAAAPEATLLVPGTPAEAMAHAPHAEVATGWRLPDGFAERAQRLRWIHAFTAGVDDFVGLPGVREGRVLLTRTVGVHTAMPEHIMGIVLAFSRRLHTDIRNQAARRWDRPAGIGDEVGGKTIGILGLGQIGRVLAARAAAFGMRVIGTQRTPKTVPHVDAVLPPDAMDEVLRQADYVVVLLPVTPATRRLVGERELRLMKSTAVLINVARGVVVQEQALLRALREGWIAGAGLDVFDQEPLPADHPLYGFEQVIITPHVSGVTPRYFDKVGGLFCENLRRYVRGEPLLHVVDAARGY